MNIKMFGDRESNKISAVLNSKRIEFRRPISSSNGFQNSATGPRKPNTTALPQQKKQPQSSLFDPSVVKDSLDWKKVVKVGPGFQNLGNTCFLNSTLQCLLYTPALTQCLMRSPPQSAEHDKTIFRLYQRLVMEVWAENPGRSISPRLMVNNIRRVGKQFRSMRQEDAHEYLRQLIDCMNEEQLKLHRLKLSDSLAETTLIHQVFGGTLQNELKCPKCSFSSKTHNSFQDLSLEVSGNIASVSDSIRAFTRPEKLSAGNEWKCEGCKAKVQAIKQMTISKAPNVLVLHLKRFSVGMSYGKVNKEIKFEPELNLTCSAPSQSAPFYKLTGIVVHHGNSSHSGHYVAFVKAPNGQWYEMNDSSVTVKSLQQVLAQKAYILFYTLKAPTTAPSHIPGCADPSLVAVSPLNAQTVTIGKDSAGSSRVVAFSQSAASSTSVNKIAPVSSRESADIGEPVRIRVASVAAAAAGSYGGGTSEISNIGADNRSVLPVPVASEQRAVMHPFESGDCRDSDDDDRILRSYDGECDSCNKIAASFRLPEKQAWRTAPFRFLGRVHTLTRWRDARRAAPLRALSLPASSHYAGEEDDKEDQETEYGGAKELTNASVVVANDENLGYEYAEESGDSNDMESGELDSPLILPSASHPRKMEVHTIYDDNRGVGKDKDASKAKQLSDPYRSLGRYGIGAGHSSDTGPTHPSLGEILSLSRRGGELGGEGLWLEEGDAGGVARAAVSAVETQQRRLEQKQRDRNKPGEWDAALDRGRVKKLKATKEVVEDTDCSSLVNAFQKEQDRVVEEGRRIGSIKRTLGDVIPLRVNHKKKREYETFKGGSSKGKKFNKFYRT